MKKIKQKGWVAPFAQLNPSTLRLSQWVKDFVPERLKRTNAHVWVRLHSMPWECWAAKPIDSPVTIDPASLRRNFCMYASVQVDIDLRFTLLQKVLIERNGHSFEVGVAYESLPEFCTHCMSIGHFVGNCRSLKRTQEEATKVNPSKETKAITTSKIAQEYAPKVIPAVSDAQQASSTEILFASPVNANDKPTAMSLLMRLWVLFYHQLNNKQTFLKLIPKLLIWSSVFILHPTLMLL